MEMPVFLFGCLSALVGGQDQSDVCKEKTKNNAVVPLFLISVVVALLINAVAFCIFKRRKQHGLVPFEAANGRIERTNDWEEVESPLGFEAVSSDQESLDVEADDRKKKSKKKISLPRMRKIFKKKEPNAMDRIGHHLQAVGISCYTPQEVESITGGFQQLTGGKYEKAYLGQLTNGTNLVAVKEFPNKEGGFQNFQTEAEMLLKVNHKNLVSTIGYCYFGSTSMLIYDDVTGSLRDYLSSKMAAVLIWKHRIEIALDVAQGLNYLHNDCKLCIIHRNVKSVNILFDKKLRAKLAGFRWSLSVPLECAYHVTRPLGTEGYIDPEYRLTGRVSVKSDVYGFGIVLLELVSSQPAFMKFKNTEATFLLSEQVKRTLDGGEDIGAIVDPRLNGDFDRNSAKLVVETAMACIRRDPSERPSMGVVVRILKECLNSL